MAALPIITGSETPILRAQTKPVAKVTKDLLVLIKDMQDTTVKADGLGLAAPQVNRAERICIVKMNGRLTPLINPQITWKSPEIENAEEGCLSLPGIWIEVPRALSITVTYLDGKGRAQERRLEKLDARIVQHEVDHLEGVLIVDYKAKAALANG